MKTWAELQAALDAVLADSSKTVDEVLAEVAKISEALKALLAEAGADDATADQASAAAVEGEKAMAKITQLKARLDQKKKVIDLATKNAENIDDFTRGVGSMPSLRTEDKTQVKASASYKRTKFFDEDEQAVKFGHFVRAIHGVESSKTWLTNHNVKMMSSAEEASAGIFIPDDIEQVIIRKRNEKSQARSLCNVVSMTGPTKTYRRQVSGPTYQVIGEGSTITTTDKIRYEDFTLTAKQIAFGTEMYANLDEDATINLADEFAEWVATEAAKTEDLFLFNGDGTSTYAGTLGIRKKFQKQVEDAGGTWATDAHKLYHPGVIVGATSLWSGFVLADYYKMPGLVDNIDESMELGYVMSRPHYYNILQPLVLAAGGVTPETVVNGVTQFRFNGYPVVLTNQMPTATAVSSVSVLFGDIKQAVDFGDRRGITIETDKNIKTQVIDVVATERFGIICHDFGTAHATAGSRVMGAMAALVTKES